MQIRARIRELEDVGPNIIILYDLDQVEHFCLAAQVFDRHLDAFLEDFDNDGRGIIVCERHGCLEQSGLACHADLISLGRMWLNLSRQLVTRLKVIHEGSQVVGVGFPLFIEMLIFCLIVVLLLIVIVLIVIEVLFKVKIFILLFTISIRVFSFYDGAIWDSRGFVLTLDIFLRLDVIFKLRRLVSASVLTGWLYLFAASLSICKICVAREHGG